MEDVVADDKKSVALLLALTAVFFQRPSIVVHRFLVDGSHTTKNRNSTKPCRVPLTQNKYENTNPAPRAAISPNNQDNPSKKNNTKPSLSCCRTKGGLPSHLSRRFGIFAMLQIIVTYTTRLVTTMSPIGRRIPK
jgi:hypothetical protein